MRSIRSLEIGNALGHPARAMPRAAESTVTCPLTTRSALSVKIIPNWSCFSRLRWHYTNGAIFRTPDNAENRKAHRLCNRGDGRAGRAPRRVLVGVPGGRGDATRTAHGGQGAQDARPLATG